MTIAVKEPRLECYAQSLQTRVEVWLETDEARGMPGAVLYRHLPALFQFLAQVALDPRISERDRAATLSALKYVIAPFDLIPEGILGVVGLRDDLVLAALTVERLAGRVAPTVLAEHWERDDDPLELSRVILDAASAMVGPDILLHLRSWHDATA